MSKIRISETKNSENVQRFINGFKLLLSSKNPYQVWSDLMLMFATSLQNSCTRFYLEGRILSHKLGMLMQERKVDDV